MKIKLLTKQQLVESLNPVLDGNSISSLNSTINYNCFNDFYDRPQFLEPDCNTTHEPNTQGPGKKYYLATMFVNGRPISPWSARFIGGQSTVNKQYQIQNYNDTSINLQSIVKQYLNNKNNIELDEIKVSKVKIHKIFKSKSTIGINVIMSFNLNEYENIWCKIENINSNTPEFKCDELNNLKKDVFIRVKGKIFNLLFNYLLVNSGEYTLIADEFYVYDQLGRIKKLLKNSVVEVVHTTKELIKIRIQEEIYIIKQPDYFFFNWYFIKN